MTKKFENVYNVLKGVNDVIESQSITNIGYKLLINDWELEHVDEEITYTVEVTNMNNEMLRTTYIVRNSQINDANYELSIRCYKVNVYGMNKLLSGGLHKDITLDELIEMLEN